MGYYSRFLDKHDGRWTIDLFSKNGYEVKGKKGHKVAEEPVEYTIDFNFLQGRARSMSCGAIVRVKKSGREADAEFKNPEGIVICRNRKMSF